jgi:hypothetical protein
VQGSGAMLAPIARMPRLHTLALEACHLNDAGALSGALCSAPGLARLRVQVCVGGGERRGQRVEE